MSRLPTLVVSLVVIALVVPLAWWAWSQRGVEVEKPGLPLVQGTSRADLDAAERLARARLAADEADVPGAVRLAEILLRKARVESDAGHAIEAEHVLKMVLAAQPGE